jgi:serine/threonine-protein phosphatase 2A activator
MAKTLEILNPKEKHQFEIPSKKIHEGQDVPVFLVSKAYRDITTFLVQLNRCMFPRKSETDAGITNFDSNTTYNYSTPILRLRELLSSLEQMIDEVPLDPGPRRFGNVAFRKWCQLLEEKVDALLEEYLSPSVASFTHETETNALAELRAYLLGAFGSAQRLDYGTGHELSFLAFLGGVWKLGGFEESNEGNEERGIVLGLVQPYVF